MRRTVLITLTILGCGTMSLQAGKFHDTCPCGPDVIKGPLRLLLMQGHKDADFRPSCRVHDDCYACLGQTQEKCDDDFLVSLLDACEGSKQPKLARFKAKFAYWLVKNIGGGAYRKAQARAAVRAGK